MLVVNAKLLMDSTELSISKTLMYYGDRSSIQVKISQVERRIGIGNALS